ncbi:putative cytochrome oxidase assembly factor 4 [Erysiphe necator]|uniref:Putative cytochrome oxidase assembly factor 4 n=1 Tax=Uncinula necator TaxID=52586 RepID=A0A0B1NZB6_UNCNE|nr:putative cytochrome oxidase assembly factor 4 [Erysiphe necator]
MSQNAVDSKSLATVVDDDDEPDDWDKRIFSTGCAAENTKMNDCFYEKKDWRLCKDELKLFKECWKKNKNDERTSTKNSNES